MNSSPGVSRSVKSFTLQDPGPSSDPTATVASAGAMAPDHRSYFSFATFNDPDGNTWLFQEVTTRLPGKRGLSNPGCGPHRAFARDGATSWPVRTDGSQAPLVGLVRRLYRRASERQDS